MATIGGARSGASSTTRAGPSDEEIRRITACRVPKAIREVIMELFGSVKTALIEEFDQRYAAITQASAAATTSTVTIVGSQRGRVM